MLLTFSRFRLLGVKDDFLLSKFLTFLGLASNDECVEVSHGMARLAGFDKPCWRFALARGLSRLLLLLGGAKASSLVRLTALRLLAARITSRQA